MNYYEDERITSAKAGGHARLRLAVPVLRPGLAFAVDQHATIKTQQL